MASFHRFLCDVLPSAVSLALLTSACQDLTAKLPAGAVDPNSYATPEAAEQMARGARFDFQEYLLTFIIDAGRISDELTLVQNTQLVLGNFNRDIILHQRHLPDETLNPSDLAKGISEIASYTGLQTIRGTTSLARRALAVYAPDSPPALRAEMFAYEAFAEVMLADLYCSGIPLSTVNFQQDFTYVPGSSTIEVYEHAVALFDSAEVLGAQDASVLSMARIGKGRALLALGRYADANAAVDGISPAFRFALPIVRVTGRTTGNPTGHPWGITATKDRMIIADGKGQIGLRFLGTADPRIKTERRTPSSTTDLTRLPERPTHLVVASGIEASLIRAEALLQSSGMAYLDVLNALRTTCTSTVGCPTPAPAGTGGIAGLPPLSDPGSDTARVSLLFRERAFWLFFTGRRQGDLRRLIRHYNRTVDQVYPRGPHPAGIGAFDAYVDVPMPAVERYNPHYTGCTGRGA